MNKYLLLVPVLLALALSYFFPIYDIVKATVIYAALTAAYIYAGN